MGHFALGRKKIEIEVQSMCSWDAREKLNSQILIEPFCYILAKS